MSSGYIHLNNCPNRLYLLGITFQSCSFIFEKSTNCYLFSRNKKCFSFALLIYWYLQKWYQTNTDCKCCDESVQVLLELICTTVSLVIISLYSPRRSCLSVHTVIYSCCWSQGLKIVNIIYCGQFQTYNAWKWQCAHHPAAIFSLFFFFFFFVIHVFYLFLKVLLESSWMISLLPGLYLCISPSFLCWVGMLEFLPWNSLD